MTAVCSGKTAICQKRPQLTAFRYTAGETYRGTLKRERGVPTVKSRGFEKLRFDRGELRDLKTAILWGILLCEVLITNRDFKIIWKVITI